LRLRLRLRLRRNVVFIEVSESVNIVVLEALDHCLILRGKGSVAVERFFSLLKGKKENITMETDRKEQTRKTC